VINAGASHAPASGPPLERGEANTGSMTRRLSRAREAPNSGKVGTDGPPGRSLAMPDGVLI
jgi:hypothetical protein